MKEFVCIETGEIISGEEIELVNLPSAIYCGIAILASDADRYCNHYTVPCWDIWKVDINTAYFSSTGVL